MKNGGFIVSATVVGAALLALVLAGGVEAQQQVGTTHTIFLTALEVKGATTADKLAPPPVNPKDVSKGCEFKGPGVADKSAPQKWEVSSYMFNRAFVTVRQSDRVNLTAFVVNGDEHEVWITDPQGKEIVPKTIWNQGRQYEISFVAEKPGAYHLTCSHHAPTMAATFLVVPR